MGKKEEVIYMGVYVSGFGGSGSSSVKCKITKNEYIFVTSGFGISGEIGRIPRDLVNSIHVEDHSQIQSRITATRMLTLGIFALAAKKKTTTKEYFLLIDWQNEKGLVENALFKFSGFGSQGLANSAAEQLKRFVLPKRDIMNKSEKKCPFCAEIIKAEAKICKHCKSVL